MLFGEATVMSYLNPGYDVWVGGETNQGETQQLHLCQLRTTESGKVEMLWSGKDGTYGNHMVTDCEVTCFIRLS